MRIEIRMVRRLKGDLLGRTRVPTKTKAIIEVSEKENRDIYIFGVTLFHELLHVWTNVMKTNGANIDMRKEHRFIYAMHIPLLNKISLMRSKTK